MFASEGLLFIIPAVVLTALFAALALWRRKTAWWIVLAVISLLFVAILGFFRDPERALPEREAVVTPTDGKVIAVEMLPDGRVKIELFLSLLDVHAIRSPVTGRVISKVHCPGKFHPAFKPEAGIENEHVRLEIDTEQGKVTTRILAGFLTRRIVCGLKPGDEISAGQRIGFIRFGSRADLVMPAGFETSLDKGDKVVGGVTLLGKYRPLTIAMVKRFMEMQGA